LEELKNEDDDDERMEKLVTNWKKIPFSTFSHSSGVKMASRRRLWNLLSSDDDIVDGNVNEFYEKTDETHDAESNGRCQRNL